MAPKILNIEVKEVDEDQRFRRVLAVGGGPSILKPYCESMTHFAWSDDLAPLSHEIDEEEKAKQSDWTHIALFADEDDHREMTKWFSTGGDHCKCCPHSQTTKLDQVGTNKMRNAKCEMRNAKCEMRNAKCEMRNAKCEMRNLHFLRDQILRKLSDLSHWLIIDNNPSHKLFDGLYRLKGSGSHRSR